MIKSYIFLFAVSAFILSSCNKNELPVLETGSQKPMPVSWLDKDTGHEIIRLTDTLSSNRSFYFHNNPFIPGKKGEGDLMIYYGSNQILQSDKWFRGGEVRQLFSINLKTKEVKQITKNTEPIFGEIVGKKCREVFYQKRDTVFATNVDNLETRTVYIFPGTIRGSISTLNADETLLAGTFAETGKDSILSNNPRKSDFFNLIFEARLLHSLFTINIETGKMEVMHSDTAWLNHVQFSPVNPAHLMFCHEGPWHKLNRIWLIDIIEKQPLLMHTRTMDMEIAGHEFFSRDGKTIWFDLQMPKGKTFFLAGVDIESGNEKRYLLERDEWSIHFNISPDQKLFAGDGGDHSQVAKAKNGQWIYLFYPEGDSLISEKLVNMKHHDYDLEPNVHFTPDGKWIVFRANFEGKSQIYGVKIKK
ncbi:MAG: oligogalacturonate lyase family protein [Bacteroidales bacterium]